MQDTFAKLACVLALLTPSFSPAAAAPPLRFAVDASTLMPWADIHEDALQGGIHFDIGSTLAAEMGRKASFVVMPRARLALALAQGQADLACGLKPDWLPGPFTWSPAFVDDADVLVTVASRPAPRGLEDVAGLPVGTINGFRYPEVDQLIGERFLRDNAPNAFSNLHKLERGRIAHALFNERFLSYQLRHGALKVRLHEPLVITRFSMGCALSGRSALKLEELSQAIHAVQRSGELAKRLKRYR